MSKIWGIARFYGMGSMEYLLESEDWLADSKLFDGAPLLLFETMEEADVAAKALLVGSGAGLIRSAQMGRLRCDHPMTA